MGSASGSSADVDGLAREVAALHALPAVAARVLAIGEEQQFCAHGLANALSSDAALAGTVLTVANSPYCGFPRRISNLRDAVVLLGFRPVRSAGLAACVMQALPRGTHGDPHAFWRFSLTVAMLADVLARATHRHADDAFLAGMLHDIGRIALDAERPDDLERAVRVATEDGMPLSEAEARALGYRDTELGAALAATWGFRPTIADAIAGNQGPLASTAAPLADDTLHGYVVRAREYARARGLDDGIDRGPAAAPAAEWAAPPIAAALEHGGGLDSLVQRASAFVDCVLEAHHATVRHAG